MKRSVYRIAMNQTKNYLGQDDKVIRRYRNCRGDVWMEPLFKDAGVCCWGWDNYAIAAEMKKALLTELKQLTIRTKTVICIQM